jgi:hypothetical protein
MKTRKNETRKTRKTNPMKHHRSPILARLAFLLVFPVFFTGCVVIKYEDPQSGRRLTYMAPAFGTKAIEYANAQTGELRGYRSEQSQMAEAIALGVASAMKPAK